MLTVSNVSMFGLAESAVAAGLPMRTKFDAKEFSAAVNSTKLTIEGQCEVQHNADLLRLSKLSNCTGGESHNCALCGAIVQMNVTAPRYWWPEMQRYHFVDIVSSMSTMHKLLPIVKQAAAQTIDFNTFKQYFTPELDVQTIVVFLNTAMSIIRNPALAPSDVLTALKAALPDGWMSTAYITTNYRQLATIYRQRKDHRLKEWHQFCEAIEALPYSQFITHNPID